MSGVSSLRRCFDQDEAPRLKSRSPCPPLRRHAYGSIWYVRLIFVFEVIVVCLWVWDSRREWAAAQATERTTSAAVYTTLGGCDTTARSTSTSASTGEGCGDSRGGGASASRSAVDLDSGGLGPPHHHHELLGPGQLPKLLILGCAKCGTTSVFEALRERPDFFGGACFRRSWCDSGSGPKEKHFFDLFWDKKFGNLAEPTRCKAYEKLYRRPVAASQGGVDPGSSTRGDAVGVDASPGYLRDAHAPSRLHHCYDDLALRRTTFLAILRDPVDRCVVELDRFNDTSL